MYISEQKSRRETLPSAPTSRFHGHEGPGLPQVGKQGLRLPYRLLTALPFSCQQQRECKSHLQGLPWTYYHFCFQAGKSSFPVVLREGSEKE